MNIRPANVKTYLSLATLFLILLGFTNFGANWERDFKKIEYQIRPTSLLEVNGKTNINSFSCTSGELFQNKKLDYKFEAKSSLIYFQNTKFDIQIEQLDCGKKKINKDLFKALKVKDYPNITIDLKEVLNIECHDLSICGEWMEFEANTEITITCETKTVSIPILVKKLDSESYRITGGTTLQLCDFDIKAPTAMLGLIKVKDAIDFNFDLYVDVKLEI
jgi:hypothetical protein